MTLPTFSEARDEIQGLFNAAWTLRTPAVNGGVVPPIDWQGVDRGEPIGPLVAQARFVLRHSPPSGQTLAPPGQRRFTRTGLVTVQILTPNSQRTGLSLAENLATIARDAYEGVGTASGIWFRNVRIVEIGPSGGLFQMNVLAEFEYDEIK